MELRNIRDTEYTVSRCGKVFAPDGVQINPWVENNTGYLLFRIRRNNKPWCLRLHRVVGECWVDNPYNLPYVKHKGDDKTNNHADNLEWGTVIDNTQEGYDNGCYQYKARSHRVVAIHRESGDVIESKSLRSLAEALGLNRKNIASILKGKKKNTYNYEFRYEMPND